MECKFKSYKPQQPVGLGEFWLSSVCRVLTGRSACPAHRWRRLTLWVLHQQQCKLQSSGGVRRRRAVRRCGRASCPSLWGVEVPSSRQRSRVQVVGRSVRRCTPFCRAARTHRCAAAVQSWLSLALMQYVADEHAKNCSLALALPHPITDQARRCTAFVVKHHVAISLTIAR